MYILSQVLTYPYSKFKIRMKSADTGTPWWLTYSYSKVQIPGPLGDSLIRTCTDKWVDLGIGSTDSGTPVYSERVKV